MPERLNDAARNRQADRMGDDLNAATLKMYTGSQPAAGAAATGTLLVTMILPADAMDAADVGVADKLGTWEDLAVADGDAGWFRIESATGSRWYDGHITDMAGDGVIKMADVHIDNGQLVTVTAFSIVQPAEA